MTASMLSRPSSAIKRWAGRTLLHTSVARRAGLSSITRIPKKLTPPFQRIGLDPLPELAELRRTDPVHRMAKVFGKNVWLVTGLDEARTVLNDTVNYSTDIRAILGTGGPDSIGGLGFTDPPEHTRLRKFLTPEFTKRRLQRLQPRIEAIVAERLDAMQAAAGPDGVVDIVPEFAFPIPFLVICELLGLPVEDRDRFRRLGNARFDVSAGAATVFGAMSESQKFLLEAVRAQRVNPGDGLIGAIIREHGDEVDDLELAGLADGVFTGGYETSASMLALGTLTLLQNPEVFGRLREEPSTAAPVVEELLRYLTVVQLPFPRFAKHDLDLYGRPIKAGDAVMCALTTANRAESFGADPDRIDPARGDRSHLAFGYGFHRCVGSELARMELAAAYPALARRFPELSLAVDVAQLEYRDISFVYGVVSLPVRLGAPAAFAPEVGAGSLTGLVGTSEGEPEPEPAP
ncbi:MAG TPA: cytochrome P450 [Jatrophihabitans sp.]|nr:cytochrome P450 [Jatrophihabitans sp.]